MATDTLILLLLGAIYLALTLLVVWGDKLKAIWLPMTRGKKIVGILIGGIKEFLFMKMLRLTKSHREGNKMHEFPIWLKSIIYLIAIATLAYAMFGLIQFITSGG